MYQAIIGSVKIMMHICMHAYECKHSVVTAEQINSNLLYKTAENSEVSKGGKLSSCHISKHYPLQDVGIEQFSSVYDVGRSLTLAGWDQ